MCGLSSFIGFGKMPYHSPNAIPRDFLDQATGEEKKRATKDGSHLRDCERA